MFLGEANWEWQDLHEIVGNILDKGCQFACAREQVSAVRLITVPVLVAQVGRFAFTASATKYLTCQSSTKNSTPISSFNTTSSSSTPQSPTPSHAPSTWRQHTIRSAKWSLLSSNASNPPPSMPKIPANPSCVPSPQPQTSSQNPNERGPATRA